MLNFSSRNNRADFSAKVSLINDACFHSSSFPQGLALPPFLVPFSNIPSARQIHCGVLISRRFCLVLLCLSSFSISLSLSLVTSPCILYISPLPSLPSIHSIRLYSSLASYAWAPPPPFCNDPRSLPLSLCPTSQPFRNDVIDDIGVDLAVFSRGFNDRIKVDGTNFDNYRSLTDFH